jgi:hypothetical protein
VTDQSRGPSADAARMRVDSADYELCWPRALLVRELTDIRDTEDPSRRHGMVERLLEEAFLGDTPKEDYEKSASGPGRSVSASLRYDFITTLIDYAPRLRKHREPTPYWSARNNSTGKTPVQRPLAQVRRDFTQLIYSMEDDGYFRRAFPASCVDGPHGLDVDPETVLADRLGKSGLWPLTPSEWDDDTFFDLIEVFHDLAARPRTRTYHSWNNCGWHFDDYATDIGRALYRWRINQLLATSTLNLRLADIGDDIGRLVRTVDDARSDLIDQALRTTEPNVAEQVAHAIALFRSRGATAHDQRSAIIALAGILEPRRDLIREQLGRPDESALFMVANKFAIRHQGDGQQGDYDPIFLDWIFWWYLATVELTDRLLARNVNGS